MNILLVSVQKDLDVIGLKYLHYYLLENGYNSFFLHLPSFDSDNRGALANINKFVQRVNPKFIGISLMSIEYPNARDLTGHLKNNFGSIPIVWGGIHPTICPKKSLNHADYVCIGEGEKTILDLARALENGKGLKSVNNLCYLENGQIKKNTLYPLIDNLDEIPSYDHIPINGFIQTKDGRIIPIDKRVFKKYARYRGTTYSIMSSRGCPFSCAYCCNNFVSNLYQTRKIRKRSVENVISELEKAANNSPEIKEINFQDDCFLAYSDQYLKEFSRAYKEKIGKSFIVRAIPTFITRVKIGYLKNAGLSWISLGLQSGSDRVCKDVYKRRSLKRDFLKAAGIIKDFNIAAFYDVILDSPFENEEDGLETVQTLMETPKPFFPQIFSLSLYLGTELHQRAEKEFPEKIEDSIKKDYLVYHKNIINNMVRLSVFLNRGFMNKLVYLYKQDPKGIKFKSALLAGNLLSLAVFEPLTYFRVIKLSQGGSYLKTLEVLPNYFKEGLMRYFNQFKT